MDQIEMKFINLKIIILLIRLYIYIINKVINYLIGMLIKS